MQITQKKDVNYRGPTNHHLFLLPQLQHAAGTHTYIVV